MGMRKSSTAQETVLNHNIGSNFTSQMDTPAGVTHGVPKDDRSEPISQIPEVLKRQQISESSLPSPVSRPAGPSQGPTKTDPSKQAFQIPDLFKSHQTPQTPLTWKTSVIITQLLILIISMVVLLCGTQGWITVYHSEFLSKNLVGFGVGIAVQIALFAPLELGKRISQIWLGRRLTTGGINCREMITAWSLIYSNSYRGVEDLWRGMGPITMFLLTFYVGEVIVLGTIGSLYYDVSLTTLKSRAMMPLFEPLDANITSIDDAGVAIDGALRATLSLGQILNPLVLQGLWSSNASQHSCDQESCTARETAVVSPITLPFSSTNIPPDTLLWDNMTAGDIIKGEMSSFTTQVVCRPAYEAAFIVDDRGRLVTHFNIDSHDVSYLAVNWALGAIGTPQIQLLQLAHHTSFEPYVDESGSVYVGVMAYNFPQKFERMASIPVPDRNMTADMSLCRIYLEAGTADAEVEIMFSRPTKVSKLISARPAAPSQLMNLTLHYTAANFIQQTHSYFTCDLMGCDFSGSIPPAFSVVPGFVGIKNGSVSVNYTSQMETVASALARMTVTMISTFSAPRTLDAARTVEIWSPLIASVMYTTRTCNVILIIGIVCASLNLSLHLASILFARTGSQNRWWKHLEPALWMTESVYVLLKAFHPSQLNRMLPHGAHEPQALRNAIGKEVLMVGAVDSKTGDMCVDTKGRIRSTTDLRVKGFGGGPPVADVIERSAELGSQQVA